MFIDRRKILSAPIPDEGYRLDIGCGGNKKSPNFIGIDILEFDCVDLIGDVLEILQSFPDQSVAQCFSSHFFEHVRSFEAIMVELGRVLKPNAEFTIKILHFSNPYFYSDPTHVRFFGLYSLSYFTRDQSIFIRKVPTYHFDLPFKILSVYLNFTSPFFPIRLFKKCYGALVNLSSATK